MNWIVAAVCAAAGKIGAMKHAAQSSAAIGIVMRWTSELLFAPEDPGQNTRHIDHIWPLWNVLDMTPEGRGASWFPKLNY